jgi:hypothetical protein
MPDSGDTGPGFRGNAEGPLRLSHDRHLVVTPVRLMPIERRTAHHPDDGSIPHQVISPRNSHRLTVAVEDVATIRGNTSTRIA